MSMIGKKLGRFEIISQLGAGGMASVWKARDSLLDRDVAVKVLDERFGSSPNGRRRFRHEGEIAALMSHPGICAVHEAGEHEGLTYLVMALIVGKTVSELVRERLIPPEHAVQMGIAAADALGYAHAMGIVHRDITSRNLMVREDGSVVLLDFGIALAYGVSRVTSTGHMLGTPAYMAPESLQGKSADPRTDVYGMGVVLYEALTGSLPFEGERPEVVRFRALNEDPARPSTLRPELGADIDDVVLKAMSREPDDRFMDGLDLAAALRALSATASEAEPRGPSSDARRGSPAAARASQQRSDIATRFTSGAQPIYLLVMPIDDVSSTLDDARPDVLRDLTDAACAGLADMERVRVVRPSTTGGPLATAAREAGANVVLVTKARSVGHTVRLTFQIIDPDGGTIYAGDNVEGTLVDPFELEDRFLQAVRSSMGFSLSKGTHGRRSTHPAAASLLAQARSYLKRFDHEPSLDGAIDILRALAESEGATSEIMAAQTRAFIAKHELTRERRWSALAAAACDRAIAADPDSIDTLLARAEVALAAGHPHQALEVADRGLNQDATHYELRLVRARALDGAGRTEEALNTCHQAIAGQPDDWRGYHVLGTLLLRHGRFADAVAPLRKATQLVPDNAGAHRNLGNAYFYMGRYENAQGAWERSIAIRPAAMTYYNIGTLLFFQERYDECLVAFEHAVALNPHDARSWGNLGAACRTIPGHEARMYQALETAISLVQEDLRRDPTNAESWAQLAGFQSNLGLHEEAIRSAEKGLEVGPDVIECMVRAGYVYSSAGNRDAALCQFEEAVKRGYGIETLLRDKELVELRRDPGFRKVLAHAHKSVGTEESTQ